MKREDDTPLHKAVRKALTNSIIHSDVFLAGGILRIEKHDDKLCFRNPGTLKLPLEEIYEGGNSKARNPKMQDMLRMIGFGENLGSGFPKILDAWKDAKWNAPTLEDRLTTEEVRLTLPIPFAEFTAGTEDTTINAEDTTINAEDTTINTEDTTINTEDTTINTDDTTINADDTTINAEDTTINTTTKTMDIILSLIKQNPKITTKELAVLCGMTKDGVYYHIKKLKGKGYIVRDEGKRHGGQWIVIDGHSDTKKIGGS